LKRSSFEIAEEILKYSVSGARITWLIYKANLTYNRAERYLAFLRETCLIEEDGDGMWRTTDKGIQFINDFRKLKEELSSSLKAKPTTYQRGQTAGYISKNIIRSYP